MAETATPARAGKHEVALQRQRSRSVAIAVSLAVLVALFYAATIVRMGKNVVPHATADASQHEAVKQ